VLNFLGQRLDRVQINLALRDAAACQLSQQLGVAQMAKRAPVLWP
jgi:hypothetical protein